MLLIGFGSVLGALLPLGGALVGVFAGLGVLGVLAASISFATSAPTLATMMGLGVPATTVVLAMCGLYASGITFIGKLGLAAAVTVAIAALAALTLGPALLGLAGSAIDRLHVRRPVAEPSRPDSPLHRYTDMLARHPWRWATSGIALLAVIAIPLLSMRLGHVGPGSEPHSWSERRAYDAISHGFGPGANGPLTIVVAPAPHTSSSEREALQSSVPASLRTVHGVASASALQPSAGGSLLIGRVLPAGGPQAAATQTLVHTLQDSALPAALEGSHASGYVTGTTAATIDFQDTVTSRLPIIIAIVVVAAFLLLLASFRSPVLALKAALLNLGASVILDATVIRLLIVPSLMFVFDAANWWMPAWLERALPQIEPRSLTLHVGRPHG